MTLKLIYPALAQILWTFIVLGIVFVRRRRAFLDKAVSPADVAVSTERYPEPARLAAANYTNQFEAPVLFFALIMVAMEVGAVGTLMAVLAWLFVLSRVVHTFVHVGSNRLHLRAIVFGLGIACLVCMWISILTTML
ncbi:hypothetical protein DWF00_12145 [Bosea caraganae]|uniref:MAPEG family protein n=1 Tax=Bosea caraganae TaxID=2763117 RepID=A0A370LCJ8_9HYPH|nr:MAPEG family protein [Bosea caraganae]RDJ27674.1 hypothetical protein DWF00_12145 [Bosea caraganae]RDJ29687.1 hypothetical protein DWE98_03915 [Bosea caraganae]